MHLISAQQLSPANALGPPLGFGLALAQVTGPAHYITPAQTHVTGPVPFVAPSAPIGPTQAVAYPVAPTTPQVNPGSIGASSHLNNSVNSLSENFNTCMYPSISVGDGRSIPVTNTGHSILPTPYKSLHLNNVLITPHIVKNLIYVRQFVRDNNYTIEFDAFGFSIKDFMTRRVLLRCDSTGDLYPVTVPSLFPHVFLVSQHTWHQRLGHPGREVLRHLVSNNFISCNKEKPLVLCHACQLGKHVRLAFVSSSIVVTSCYEIIHSDVWTSPIPSLSWFKYYVLFLDHYSQFVWVYRMLNKSDVWSKFVLSRTYVRTQLKCEIRSFQCDHGDGTLSRYKARFVTNGSTRLEEVDVDETFSPVVKRGTIRTVLSLPASRHWSIHQLNVKNAFLHGDLSETVYMHQPPRFWDSVHPDYKYDVEILDRAHMVNCNPSRTPIDTESKLGSDGDPVSDPTLYRSLTGSLQYLTFTRPDISYAVQQVIVFFLATTYSFGPLSANRRFLVQAEYRGVANAIAETCWLRNLLRELHIPLTSTTLVYCDNVSVVYLSCNPVQHQRTKHIDIDIHFVRDLVAAGQVRVLHVPSRYQFADISPMDCRQLYSKSFDRSCVDVSATAYRKLRAGSQGTIYHSYTKHACQRENTESDKAKFVITGANDLTDPKADEEDGAKDEDARLDMLYSWVYCSSAGFICIMDSSVPSGSNATWLRLDAYVQVGSQAVHDGILKLVFLGVEGRRVVPDWILSLANDRVGWDKYHCGSYVWPTLYSQLKNANVRRWSSLYVSQLIDQVDKKTYSIFEFTWVFKTWILESFRVMATTYYNRHNRYPVAAAWSKKGKRFLRRMVVDFFHRNLPIARLTPDDIEARSEWWVSSKAYFAALLIIEARSEWWVSNPDKQLVLEYGYTNKLANTNAIVTCQIPSHMGNPKSQTPIETRPDAAGLFDLNIPNRGKREQRPNYFRRTPYVEQAPTRVLPKQRGNKKE
uniref:Ribonuclease H-like domain-containing protein n=1 Tax=Tanacetum cinerariifolium TaxID=118510 RepID=A0A699GUP0_TANCI|nr:ribonuclease H-like domain-containing protein [Tanacetum cinerariifolium]